MKAITRRTATIVVAQQLLQGLGEGVDPGLAVHLHHDVGLVAGVNVHHRQKELHAVSCTGLTKAA